MGCSPSMLLASLSEETQPTHTSHKRGGITRVFAKGNKVGPGRKKLQVSLSWSEPVMVTQTQKKLVAKTMYNLRVQLSEVGIQVFRTIFSIQPHLKELFPFRNKKDEDLEYDMAFRTHAARFMAFVGCAIQSLDKEDSEQLNDLCHRLGAQHRHLRGFQRSTFTVFKDALLIAMAHHFPEGNDKYKGEVYKAWDAVVKHIIQLLQNGYKAANEGEARDDIDDLQVIFENQAEADEADDTAASGSSQPKFAEEKSSGDGHARSQQEHSPTN